MTPAILLHRIIRPGLALLQDLGGPLAANPAAERMLVAIAHQESGLTHRAQMRGGPATGLWQFERGGGVAGVLRHPASAQLAASLCGALLTRADDEDVHPCLVNNDLLAVGFARLLLLTDPRALPSNPAGAWDCYERNWRPGKPHLARWPKSWDVALAAVGTATRAV